MKTIRTQKKIPKKPTALYTNHDEATYTREAHVASRKIMLALVPVYPELRRTYTRSQVQHLVLEALRSVGIFEVLLCKDPAEAIKTSAACTYGAANS